MEKFVIFFSIFLLSIYSQHIENITIKLENIEKNFTGLLKEIRIYRKARF